MKTTGVKKISLVRYSIYSIGLYVCILLGEFYIIIKNILPSTPIYIGPIYLPLLISVILLLLLIAAGVLLMTQYRKRETTDELANLNNYKAGYITKYVSIFVIAIIILLVKDFNLVLKEDIVGNALSVFLISLSFTELIHNIIFIILEKKWNRV